MCDRLQHHVGHEDVGQRGSRRNVHRQPVLEPDLLDREQRQMRGRLIDA
jgi:hypothetical protein